MSLNVQVESPKTQSIDGVKALLAFVGRSSDPLPTDVSLDGGRLVLVLTGKRDAYYVATQKACSCPAAIWHPGHQCKHQRKYFADVAPSTHTKPADTGTSLIKRGGFRPIDSLPGEERATSSLSVVDCFDTRDIDAAYHSIKEDREMWPAEA
jgi:hypothetical protein